MPRPKLLGSSITPLLTGARLSTGVPTTKAAVPPLEVRKYTQNGDPPSAQYWNLLNETANGAALFRGKQVFSWSSRVGLNAVAIPSSAAGTRNRWRAAFHLGPYTTRLMARVVICPPNNNYGNATYGKLTVFSGTTEAVTAGAVTFYFGAGPGTTTVNGYQYLKEIMLPIEGLTADTDYTLRFDDVDYARIVSASVFELPSLTESSVAGYLPQNLTQDSEVLHIYRSNVATIERALWRRGGATVFNWTADSQASPRTITTAATNIIDGTSTTYGDSIPGYTFDMTGKARLSQTTGVPVRMQVYASISGTGAVTFRDSAGTSVINIPITGGAAWYTGTGVMPASSAKYYLTGHVDLPGFDTLTAYAASLYEYEA